jgi:Ser/Thr protein kinase RdoA (MazF antagonist)
LYKGNEKNGNNFRADAGSVSYVLKKSRINEPESQKLVNECIAYLKGKSVPVPEIIPTLNGSTFYEEGRDIFCLYGFIGGENFDGSGDELENVAVGIGRLHKALENLPYKDEVKKLKGEVIRHDRELLENISKKLRENGERTEFDSYVLGILDEIDECSREIGGAEIDGLPFQAVHYDLHPHNVLFNGESKEVLAFLDFDPLCYSQRARDVGFGMHRFARTYGEKTERKLDVGAGLNDRANLFLKAYIETNQIKDEEIKALPLLIQDEAIRRVIIILDNHYFKNDTTWSFDLGKQVTTLREGKLFHF